MLSIELYYTYDNFCVTKIKYIMYNVQDSSVFYNDAVRQVICEGWNSHIWGKHVLGRIISLRREVCVHNTSVNPVRFTEVLVPIRKVYLFVGYIYFSIGFWSCSDSVVFLFFILFHWYTNCIIVPCNSMPPYVSHTNTQSQWLQTELLNVHSNCNLYETNVAMFKNLWNQSDTLGIYWCEMFLVSHLLFYVKQKSKMAPIESTVWYG